MLSISAGDDDSDEDDSQRSSSGGGAPPRDSFMLSQSGTFKLSDFSVNRSGYSRAPAKTSAGASMAGAPIAEDEEEPTKRVDVRSLDQLTFLQELGAGASGTVRLAKHTPTGVLVAVKSIQILEKPRRDQMVSELRIMSTHTSPWLVSLFNAFYEEAKVYMVLEFMDGGSIASLVAANPSGVTDERELAKIATQILNGLNYLHRQHHQVHRDLKPANVLFNKRGQVRHVASQPAGPLPGAPTTSLFAPLGPHVPTRR